jgi:hypothetical protein
LESRDLEVAPTGVCRESEFPPTEELNASERVLGLLVFGFLPALVGSRDREVAPTKEVTVQEKSLLQLKKR